MHAYYASRAPYYDAVYLKPERQADIAFLSTYLATRFEAREVLEVACGTGYWTQHIAPACKRIVATDATPEPLELARQRLAGSNTEFLLADAYALPSDLGAFDGAFAGLWFSHVPRAARFAFLSGLHRRLRPGARVILIDNNEVQLGDFPIDETDEQGNTYQRRVLRDGSVHRVLKNFPTASELKELLSGFTDDVSYRNLQNFWLLEYELPRGV